MASDEETRVRSILEDVKQEMEVVHFSPDSENGNPKGGAELINGKSIAKIIKITLINTPQHSGLWYQAV
jgi:hypothetical protein